MNSYTIAALVENSAGVLTRIANLFARRGFNIDSLAVGETQDPHLSRITIVTTCDERAFDQIVEQLRKQVCVRKVSVLPGASSIHRELLLVKIATNSQNRTEVLELGSIFRARTLDVSEGSLTLELTGQWDKLEAFIRLITPFGILEMARTGSVALQRGDETIYGEDDPG